MAVDEGNLQVINNVDVILEKCPLTNVVHYNLLVYSTIAILVYDNTCDRNPILS